MVLCDVAGNVQRQIQLWVQDQMILGEQSLNITFQADIATLHLDVRKLA